jgi:hypothetical protein
MAISRTPDEILQDYTATMGPKLGPAFHRLYNDNAWLHMKWNEFLKLFVKSPAQMRDLNTAAPGFFHQVQEFWWDDMLLHIFRMTDKRTDVLSVYTLGDDAGVDGVAVVVDVVLHLVHSADKAAAEQALEAGGQHGLCAWRR